MTVKSARPLAGGVTTALMLLAAWSVGADEPMAPPTCSLRLSVEVTPDVPNPTDSGFISSLLGDNAGFELFLVQRVDDTHVDLQLQGPGPMDNCRAVVKSMRDDGRVSSIHVH